MTVRSDSWITPPAIIEALGGAGTFDLDPCACSPQPFRTAQQCYTLQDNGLLLPWFDRVWLNPPYSNPLLAKFLNRMAEHGRGTALIFARTDTSAFHRYVWPSATGILFLRGRLTFHLPDGSPAKDAGAPSVLVAYGSEDRDILAAAPIDGAFVPLRLPKSMLVHGIKSTWAEALDGFFAKHDGPIALAELYRAFLDHPKVRGKQFWRDKLRQSLQQGEYERVDKGTWQRRAAA